MIEKIIEKIFSMGDNKHNPMGKTLERGDKSGLSLYLL
jgi:hypothetical protein